MTISVGPTNDGYSGSLTVSPGNFVCTLTAPPGLASGPSVVTISDKAVGVGSYVPASFSANTAVAAVNGAATILASTVGLWPGDRRILSIRKQLLVAYNASIGVDIGTGFAPVAPPVIVWTPALLPGLKGWWKSDIGVSLNGSTVSAWVDQSGQRNNVDQATPADQPAYHTSGGQNGLPYLTFAAGAVSLFNSTTSIFTAGQSRTIFIVCAPSSTVGGTLFTNRLSVDIATFQWYAAGGHNYVYSDGVAVNSTITTAPTAAFHVVQYEFSGAGTPLAVSIDGIAQVVTNVPANNESGTVGFMIGNRSDASGQGFVGNIYEVIVCTGILSSSDVSSTNAYIQERYGAL